MKEKPKQNKSIDNKKQAPVNMNSARMMNLRSAIMGNKRGKK